MKLKSSTLRTWQRWWFISNRTVRVSGLNLGGVVTEKYRQGKYAVWHVAGHTGWSGVGQTEYYGPTYYVVEAVVDRPVTFMFEIDADRSTWRECLRLCIQKVNMLSSEGLLNEIEEDRRSGDER